MLAIESLQAVTSLSWRTQFIGGAFICLGAGAIVAFNILLGFFAFANPDPEAYYIAGTEVAQARLFLPDTHVDGAIDVHFLFVLWFRWSFANHFTVLILCLYHIAEFMSNFQMKPICCCCVNPLMSSLCLAYIAGLVLRLSAVGRFATGDMITDDDDFGHLYQLYSGKFMSLYYLLTIGMVAFAVCSAIFAFIIQLALRCICRELETPGAGTDQDDEWRRIPSL